MNGIQSIINLLRSDNYITVNKTLSRKIGLINATVYTEMLSKYYYFHQQKLLKDGYFYLTIETLKDEIGLSREQQDTVLKALVKLGLIEKKVAKLKGDEAPKRYFKIIDDIGLILSLFQEDKKDNESIDNTGNVEKTQNHMREEDNSICGKDTTNNINILDYKYNNNQSVSQDTSPDDEIEKIIENADVNLYQAKLFISQVILKLYTDRAIAYQLKMGLNHQDIKDRLKQLRHAHIDRALSKMQGIEVKNKEIYFAKCLLTAIIEIDLDFLNED